MKAKLGIFTREGPILGAERLASGAVVATVDTGKNGRAKLEFSREELLKLLAASDGAPQARSTTA
jgi:hypothetical protein